MFHFRVQASYLSTLPHWDCRLFASRHSSLDVWCELVNFGAKERPSQQIGDTKPTETEQDNVAVSTANKFTSRVLIHYSASTDSRSGAGASLFRLLEADGELGKEEETFAGFAWSASIGSSNFATCSSLGVGVEGQDLH